MSKVLVIAVHPDDETLGCGGTLLKHKADGDELSWLILTKSKDSSFQDVRDKEILEAGKLYGFANIINIGWETTKLDQLSMSELVGKISDAINKIQPATIYLQYGKDVHTDHQVAFKAAYSCTKNFRYPFIKKILVMETLSETEFVPSNVEEAFNPNVFVDISNYMDKKIDIMNIYKSEIKESPFPRSEKVIRALASYRGSSIGAEYAESFMLIKEIR